MQVAVEVECPMKWPRSCNTCVVKGSWDNWTKEIPLKVIKDGARITVPLKPGYYEYKFIVDGEWKYHPTRRTTRSPEGYINNLLETVDFKHHINFGDWNLDGCFYDYENGWLHSVGCDHISDETDSEDLQSVDRIDESDSDDSPGTPDIEPDPEDYMHPGATYGSSKY